MLHSIVILDKRGAFTRSICCCKENRLGWLSLKGQMLRIIHYRSLCVYVCVISIIFYASWQQKELLTLYEHTSQFCGRAACLNATINLIWCRNSLRDNDIPNQDYFQELFVYHRFRWRIECITPIISIRSSSAIHASNAYFWSKFIIPGAHYEWKNGKKVDNNRELNFQFILPNAVAFSFFFILHITNNDCSRFA